MTKENYHELSKKEVKGSNKKVDATADINVLDIPSAPDNLICPRSKLWEDNMGNAPIEDDGKTMKSTQMENRSSGNDVKK